MYNEYLDTLDLSIVDKDNCHMIYAKEEKINIITQQTLDKIKNKTILEGKHEMFSDSSHSVKFFQTLKYLLEKPKLNNLLLDTTHN